MPNRKLFFLQALVLLVVGAIHIAALEWFLYWRFLWLDSPVHFLGGLWAGMISLWTLAAYHKATFFRTACFVIAISIAWELFEFTIGAPREANFVGDTAMDLCMDVCGGLVGYFVARSMVE